MSASWADSQSTGARDFSSTTLRSFNGSWPTSLWTVFLCVFVLGSTLSFLVPPDVSPDELDHVMRAYTVAHGQLMLKPADVNGNSGGVVDSGLVQFLNSYRSLVSDGRMTLRRYQDGLRATWTGQRIDVPFPGTGFYFPAIYAPQAVALWIGEHAGWRVDTSYRLMRALTLGVSLAGIALAFVISCPNALTIILSLLPMSIFQMVCPTIDGMALMLTMLSLSAFLRLWHDGFNASRAHWILFHFCMLVLVNSRAQALPLLVLPFILFVGCRRKSDLIAGVTQTLLALAWIAVVARYNVDTRITSSYGLRAAAVHYGAHPVELTKALWHTLLNPVRLRFYGDSFVGVLGWLDIYLPRPFYMFSAIMLVSGILASLGKPARRRDLVVAGIMCMLALASALIVFIAMLATWTPQPAHDIEGVQGRYLVQPALILASAISLAFEQPPLLLRRVGAITVAIYFVVSAVILSQALLDRYWFRAARISLNQEVDYHYLQPVFLPRGTVLEGRVSAPLTGFMDAVIFQVGTVQGKADGAITLQVCSRTTCVQGQADLSSARDNALLTFHLDRALPVETSIPVRFTLGSTSQAPGAIWAYAGAVVETGTTMNGISQTYVPRIYGEFSLDR